MAAAWIRVPYELLLIVILVEGFRRDRTEALLATFPIVLYMYGAFSNYLVAAFDIRNEFYPADLGITVVDIVAMLMVLVIGALALRRFVRTRVRDSLAHGRLPGRIWSRRSSCSSACWFQRRCTRPHSLSRREYRSCADGRRRLLPGSCHNPMASCW